MTRPIFFVDEDDIGLGKALARHHQGVVYPGHNGLPEVPRGTDDDDWLPIIGERRLVVISRDRHTYTRPVERLMWQRYRVRGFVLSGRASQSTEDSLSILLGHWPAISRLIDQHPHGPWRYTVTRGRLIERSLDDKPRRPTG